jgi:DNA-binding CsgD family transcriptional regulator
MLLDRLIRAHYYQPEMQNFLLVFYVLFFATGFMGGTALVLLSMKVRSRVLRPLLAFQLLFLLGMGLAIVYFYLESLPGGLDRGVGLTILLIVMGINAAVWGVVVVIIRRISPRSSSGRGYPLTAEILAWLVIAKSIANMVQMALSHTGAGGIVPPAADETWLLGGHILSGLAMAAFGVTARGPISRNEPAVLHPLFRAYGLCAIIFAPIGVIEYAVQSAQLPWLSYISLDHLFYLSWNAISMSAALRLFRPAEAGSPLLDAVPQERVQALSLSAREVEMAVMIARGLANKEIAAELNISPATVRTHIYNLYRKAGARSRVELINKLST